MLLLLAFSKAGTDSLGFELLLVVSQDDFFDIIPFGKVKPGEVLKTFVPVIGVIQEEADELVDLSLISGPLADPSGFVKAIQEVPGVRAFLSLRP